jgi:BASS family bile acid:Na+ symporter
VHLLKGNVALSVAMTTINSFITLLTIPVVINIALGRFMSFGADLQMPFWGTVLQILLITVLPVSVGILVRAQFRNFAISAEKPLKMLMPILLAFAILGAVFYDNENKVEYTKELLLEILPWIVGLNLLGMVFGFLLALLFRLGKRNQITIAIEVGLQNSGLAIAVAVGPHLLHNSDFAIPAAIYALFTFFTAVSFGIYIKRRNIKHIAKTIPRKVVRKKR